MKSKSKQLNENVVVRVIKNAVFSIGMNRLSMFRIYKHKGSIQSSLLDVNEGTSQLRSLPLPFDAEQNGASKK